MFKKSTIAALRQMATEFGDTEVKGKDIGDFRKLYNENLGLDQEPLGVEIFSVKKELGLTGRSLNPVQAIKILDNVPLELAEAALPSDVDKTDPFWPVPAPASSVFVEPQKTPNGLVSVFAQKPVIPEVDKEFVPFGCFTKVQKVMKSDLPMTVWVTGEKGYGKTKAITQAAAKNDRHMPIISITSETTEDDLIGGLRIIDGSTVFQKGSLIWAMEHGEPVLLDEIDLGGSKLMCLQGVLDHSGIYIKKTGEFIKPKPGFQVFMTSNTKGSGDVSDRYIHTQILNSAFMDRVDTILDHGAPVKSVEMKIIANAVEGLGVGDKISNEDIGNMCEWTKRIRENVSTGVLDEDLSTRALVKVVKNMAVFGGTVISNITNVIHKSEDDDWIEALKRFFKEVVEADDIESQGEPEEGTQAAAN